MVLQELQKNNGTLSEALKMRLALEAFKTTAAYDAAIFNYFKGETSSDAAQEFPAELNLSFKKALDLRYGENPHQKAALYRETASKEPCVSLATTLWRKELSFNNLVDADSACELVKEFEKPACAIIKHNNPCGVAQDDNLAEAWEKALATDRQAPFGGIIAVNREIDLGLAAKISEIFSEVIIAPSFAAEALGLLAKKKNLRLMIQKPDATAQNPALEMRYCPGGLLLQE